MNGIAEVTILGTLTRDPELRYTPKGTAVCQFSVAVNSQFKNEAGEKIEKATFIECTAWLAAGETIATYLRKGDPIFVTGRLEMESWADKESGTKRSRLKVVVGQFRFVGGKRDKEAHNDGGQEQGRQSQRRQASTRPADGEPGEDDDVPF